MNKKGMAGKDIFIAILFGLNIVLVILMVLILTGVIKINDSKENINNNDNNTIISDDNSSNTNTNKVTYNFGDEVIISKLKNVDLGYGGDNLFDFSKWNVLEDNGNSLVLYMNNVYKKGYDFEGTSEFVNLLSNNGVTITKAMLLNEKYLKLLGCNLETKKCDNTYDWVGSSLTEYVSDNSVYYLDNVDGNLNLKPFPNGGVTLVPIKPVIIIDKNNL